jgi:2-polyprenyl-3-methyl-5-hydroxy-6-metoxy-1,4-benzoquinol methylase
VRQIFDPNGEEAAMLAGFGVVLTGARVLEIGCGDGRLTLPIAAAARSVVAIDPDEAAIATAVAELPEHLGDRVEYRVGSALALQASPGVFEVAFFSRSL